MPLFFKRFNPKKAPARKAKTLSSWSRELDGVQVEKEFGLEPNPVQLQLGDQSITFDNGSWHSASNGGQNRSNKEVKKLLKENQRLVEENNFLVVKVEILLDMLTETTAEVRMKDEEIERLREADSD